jgi:predicted short-subunit dehydrogenase-like oxidoreductase (DUF2520 family)
VSCGLILGRPAPICDLRSFCYAPGVKRLSIAIVGAGRLGTALAQRLSEAGYEVSKINSRRTPRPKRLSADVIWFCILDAEIAAAARSFSGAEWKGKFAFHSSGVLTSDVLNPLRRAGARVASVHPLMTFVKGSVPNLAGVPFAIEGDPSAVRLARQIVGDLGADPVRIRKQDKVSYHAFATMICPLFVSLLAASEKAAALAGIPKIEARRRMMPILRQTLGNYEKLGPAGAFSGPIVRGDVETIRVHLEVLAKAPSAKNVYVALGRAALDFLPNRNRSQIARLLKADFSANSPRPIEFAEETFRRVITPGRTRRNVTRTNPASTRSTRRS